MIDRRITVLVALFLTAAPILGQSEENAPPVLTVTGRAEVRRAPDEAIVRLGVTRQHKLARDAQEKANRAAREILKATTRLGVKAERIQTSGLQLWPIYAPRKTDSYQEPRIVSYRASFRISIRLAELSRIGPVIDAALEKGANELNGVSFGLRDDASALETALQAAVQKASRKAEAMAETLGVKLVELIEVEEIVPLAYAETGVIGALSERVTVTPVSAGQVTIEANVRLRYRIGN